MKKAILTWTLILSLGATQLSLAASAPKHRYHPTTQQVDKQEATPQEKADKNEAAEQKQSADDEGVEAYSDTTDVDTTAANDYADSGNDLRNNYHSKYSLGNYDDPFDFFGSVFGKGALVAIVILSVVFGLAFFFAPLIIIWLVIRYLMRRHNDRVKLAEMAMEKGINVPESERPIDKQSDEYLVKRGIRNTFLGLGLFAMFAWWDSSFLAGIGALIGIYGLGQTVIGSLPAIKKMWNGREGNQSAGYNGTSSNDTGYNGTSI